MCNENNSEKNVSAGVARLFAGKSVYLRNESGGACLFCGRVCRGWSRITGCHYHITGDEYRICIGHGVGVWGRNVSAVAGCRLFEKAEDNGKDGTCRLFVGSGNMGHVGNKVFACSV